MRLSLGKALLFASGLSGAVFPALVYALAFFDGPGVTNPNTIDRPGFGFLDGAGYLFTANPANPGFGFSCSGSAISNRLVLTAAHCFDFDVNGSPDNTRSQFSYWSSGTTRTVASITGRVVVSPKFTASTANGFTATNDIALVVLDSSLPTSVPKSSIYAGPLDRRGLDQIKSQVSEVGFGRYYEEGVQVTSGGQGERHLGFNRVDAYHAERGGLLSATLDFGEAITAKGDSGGPLEFWPDGLGVGVPVVVGVTSFGSDVQRNGSFADIGDQAYWTFVGDEIDFVLSVARQNGEEPRTFRHVFNKFEDCPPHLICKPTRSPFEPAVSEILPEGVVIVPPDLVPSPVPEPGVWMTLTAGLVGVIAAVRRRRSL